MKLKFILLSLFFFSTLNLAQIKKYTAYSISTREDNGSSWNDWSKPEDVDILISINTGDDKIKIYSKVTQIYDIISYKAKETDSDGDNTYPMYCEDADGQNCHVEFVVLNSQDSRLQLYVRYSNVEWVYNMEPL